MSPLQPRTVGQLLDLGFEVIRFRVRTVAIVTVVIGLPLVVLPQVALALFGEAQNPFEILADPTAVATTSGELSDGYLATMGFSYLSLFLAAIAPMLMGVCLSRLIGGWVLGVDHTPRELFEFLRGRLATTSGSFLLSMLLKAVGVMCTCYLGAFYLIPVLSVLAPVVGNEGLGAGESIKRSLKLGGRRWGPLLGISILWGLAAGLVAMALSVTAALVSGLVSSNASLAYDVFTVGNTLVSLGLMAVQVSVATLAYFDVRIRTEGLDLELALAETFR